MGGIIVIDLAASRSERKRTKNFRPGRRRTPEDRSYNSASVIAIDPGGTTGWSLMSVEPWCMNDPNERVIDNIITHCHGELSSNVTDTMTLHEGESIVTDYLWEFIHSWPEVPIVIEDFVIRSRDTSRQFLSPVRITSALEYLCWKYQRAHFRQTPADAKTTISDQRLKSWGLYDKYGSLEHARDADRHATLFLRKAKDNPGTRALAWPHLYGKNGLYNPQGG